MDNAAIAHVLREIADLLEIKDDNPFKIRAYRNGADIVSNHPHEMAALDVTGLREIPGIGKDLAARIREIVETGDAEFHRELIAEFPPTILDLLNLQGVGPKTVAMLYRELGIRTIEDLEKAGAEGRIRSLRGMGAKKEALILKALADRKRHAGRHLLPDAHDIASALVGWLREYEPDAPIEAVGSLRRGCETCGDIDILASGASPALMEKFAEYRLVERVLALGDTKSSVLLHGGFQADLRLVAADSRGAALQYFTGSKAHNIALRDRAIGLGFKLNEYGLFRVEGDEKVAGETEEGVYEGSAFNGSRPSFARIGARSALRLAARFPVWSIAQTCAATFTCTRPRPTARRTSREWPPPHGPAASSTSPSPITASRWQWPTGWTSGAPSSTPPASAPPTAATAFVRWPGSNATSGRTARWTWRPTVLPPSISSSRPFTRRSTRIAAR